MRIAKTQCIQYFYTEPFICVLTFLLLMCQHPYFVKYELFVDISQIIRQ